MAAVPPLTRSVSGIMIKGRTRLESPRRAVRIGEGTFEATYDVISKTARGTFFPFVPPPRKVDFNSPETQIAMSVLKRLLLPLVLRKVLRARKKKRLGNCSVFREYTVDSIVQACQSSHSIISFWPEEILRVFAEEAVYFYLEPTEIIVYEREWYVSAGIVVLLHGELTETKKLGSETLSMKNDAFRLHSAPGVFCDRVVLCKDASSSCIAARGYADVAVLPPRWVWDVISSYILQVSAEGVLDSLRMSIAPMCCNIVNQTYFPMSLLLRRSWMWSSFSSGDRIRLSRLMSVKVFCIGDTLFNEGDRHPYMYIIRRGAVKLLIKNEPLLDFEAGTAFGEIGIIFDEPRCSQVVATTMCEVYCLHRGHLVKYLRKKKAVSERLVENALQRRKQWLEDGKTRDLMGLASLLSAIPCLSHLTEKMRTCLSMKANVHIFPPRHTLFKKGMRCDLLFVIGRGTLGLNDGNGSKSLRATTEFVGEFCLHPHLWPTDVFAETSVDGWSLSASAIMEVLSDNHADLQAVDICRQGIDLYRAQHGAESLIEEFVCPTPPPSFPSCLGNNTGTPRKRRPTSAFPAEDKTTTAPVASFVSSSQALNNEAITTDFDWNAYVLKNKVTIEEDAYSEATKHPERRALEQSIEMELNRRSGELLSVSEKQSCCDADCDFPGEMSDLQQVLVEQALLMPTERQPLFLRQINRNRVTLVVEDGSATLGDGSSENSVPNDLLLPQYVVPPPPVSTLDSVDVLYDDNPLLGHGDIVPFSHSTVECTLGITSKRSCTPETSHAFRSQTFTPRMGDEGGRHISKTRPQSGVSHRPSALRPSSAVLVGRYTPRARSAGCRPSLSPCPSFSSRGSVFAPFSESRASETYSGGEQSSAGTWTKSNRVDLSQRAKIGVTAFQSALDRLVKLDDQNYFQGMVPVSLTSQMEEHWLKEKTSTSLKNKDSFILLLMHVRRCGNLMLSSSIESPIVKVTTNSRVLMRTPVMQDLVRPVWSIEVASFISFVRRDCEVVFTVCDADNEERVAYTTRLPTSELQENGGVGIRSLSLLSCAEELCSTDVFTDVKAYVEVCMMAVSSSKYQSMQKQLELEVDDTKSSDDFNAVYLQVLSVGGLKHRIEAVVCVSVVTDGDTKEVMRTAKIETKTRNPAWPGQSSFCVVQSDGVVSFDLYHRDAFLASYDTPIDTLVFGGTDIYSFPLSRAQGNVGDVYGELMVSVLGVKTPSSEESTAQRRAKVLIVHVESMQLSPNWEDEEEFTPDPFVILREPRGGVILRTPLKLGTYNPTWAEEGASCFIMCPSLLGCNATYRFEVYDNNEANKIGTAELTVTKNGTRRNCMKLAVGSRGTLTLLAHSFTLLDIPQPPHPSPVGNGTLSSFTMHENDYLLMIHVSGCDNLQGTGFDDFQIDPVVTARMGRKRFVVAPLVSGCTAPRWPYPKATFVLSVAREPIGHITFEVWDTNIELCDVLGVARVSIRELCHTGTFHFNLQPHKNQEFGRTHNFGTLSVKTCFGRMNSEVVGEGSTEFFTAGGTCSLGLFDSRFLYNNCNSPDLPVTQVRLHVSSCCSLWADVAVKWVKVTVSCLQHVLLEVKKKCANFSIPAWSLAEAQTVLDLRAFYSRSIQLTVACCSGASETDFAPVGYALVPFSTLVSSSPETVSVRSFYMTDSIAEGSGSRCESQAEMCRENSVNARMPTITISLLALDAVHSVVEDND